MHERNAPNSREIPNASELSPGSSPLPDRRLVKSAGELEHSDTPVSDYLQDVMLPEGGISNISRAALQALISAGVEYDWQILTHDSGGHIRTVVLFGETHYTSELGESLAAGVLELFPYRAAEGLRVENYPMSGTLKKVFKSKREIALGGALGEEMTHGGAISVSAEQERRQLEKKASLYQRVVQTIDRAREEQEPGAPLVVSLDTEGLELSPEEINTMMAELLQQVSLVNEQDLPPLPGLKPLIRRFPLELDHRPDFVEKIEVYKDCAEHLLYTAAEKPLFRKFVLGSAALMPFALTASFLTHSPLAYKATALLVPGTAVLGFLVGSLLTAKYLKPVGQALNRFERSLLKHSGAQREKTMLRNLLRTLQEHPEIDAMVVQSGKAHIPALSAGLQNSGWELQMKSAMDPEYT